ncbi:MAG TPA: 16S rRNA (cytosine(1402)-N(4))-methyltransferase RsmH [Candidatus Pacearchaeota archaeon]|nr:16S rRNA (cytosine(1402)-N(4))-methyltransferase RsmH [Candidatus Pacearchaeota archaeon]HPR80102.1 16S rRNA (cytosine(1402)-N(4))-methyltransferase RsmH [Candidatus Pacearchaeota archaeon]
MHIPVLLKEVIEYLDVKPNGNYIDCTLNGGGHTREILKKNGPDGKVLGIEIDKEIFEKIEKEKIERLIPVNDSYVNVKKITEEKEFSSVKGILFDIGMSSYHVDEAERGFSFNKDEPLIMNYSTGLTAEKILNEWSEDEIEKILREYGEEKFSKKIAKKIVETRKREKIKSTLQLVNIIKEATPGWYHHGKTNLATRTFQALRIKVNNELDNFRKALPEALSLLEKDGVLVVISFHSLEDRVIKEFLKEKEKNGELKILTKKPIVPEDQEKQLNPRSRSSKLRAAIKI